MNALLSALVLASTPACPPALEAVLQEGRPCAIEEVAALPEGKQAAFARSLDLTGTPAANELREALRARWEKTGLRAAPANGMTVSDVGRLSVVRDTTRQVWGAGLSIDNLFNGLDGSVRAFYEAHPDADPDFVVVVQDWLNTSFLGAFYQPVENDVQGIGYVHFDGRHTFDDDPTTGIEGVLWLNGAQVFLNDLIIGILWGQEFGHRWGSFVYFQDGPALSSALLGRQAAHWSYYVDSDWSWFEGNDWADNGDGTFTTNNASFDTIAHYSPLDLYLMGLVGTADVPAFTLLENPAGGPPADAGPAEWQNDTVTVSATPKTVTIQQVVAAEGARVPSHLASPKSFEVAVIYALRQDDRASAAELAAMELVLDKMIASWNFDVANRATIAFGPAGTPNAAPIVTLSAPDSGSQHEGVRFTATATDPEGQALTYRWRFATGDEFVEAGPSVKHTFGSTGAKDVEVSVIDANGAETIVGHTLTIDEATGCGCHTASSHAPLAPLASAGLLALVLVARRRS